jgi:hypothetical protein
VNPPVDAGKAKERTCRPHVGTNQQRSSTSVYGSKADICN